MGQSIQVEAAQVGESAIFSTDRSITGQDGASYGSMEEAAADSRFPGLLATRMFEADDALTSIFVASNQVVAGRDGGWTEDGIAATSQLISEFFLFYPAT